MGVKKNFSQAVSEMIGVAKAGEQQSVDVFDEMIDVPSDEFSEEADDNSFESYDLKSDALAEQFKPSPGVTTIANGTIIIGEVNADGDIELLGSVKGKVISQGNIKVNGKVIGDVKGKDIELRSCAVQGNISAKGMVTVDGESVVIGDVEGENFSLDGKIKGNVTVEKEAKFQPNAILAGNVTTASIAMSQGAKIQGEVNIPINDKESEAPFDIEIMI